MWGAMNAKGILESDSYPVLTFRTKKAVVRFSALEEISPSQPTKIPYGFISVFTQEGL
jgi:hypothetical protein